MSLDSALHALDARRTALLDELAPLDPAVLVARPQPGKWTILEIVEHLVLAERDVFGDPSGLDRLVPRPRTVRHHLGYLVVMFVLRFGVPVAAPSRGMLPRGGHTLAELRGRWDENMAALTRYLAGLDGPARRRAVFRHPIAGPLTPAQAIRMDRIHIARHARQIARLRQWIATGPPP